MLFLAFLEDDDGLNAVLCEFDAVIEDFTSPVEKRHFRYDEHLKTMKRRSSASVSDSGISDSESEYAICSALVAKVAFDVSLFQKFDSSARTCSCLWGIISSRFKLRSLNYK